MDVEIDDAQVSQAVNALKTANVNFVAIDFDRTLISLHTGGRFPGTAEELALYVRPVFFKLVPAIAAAGIHIAIVTFSPQISMIKKVLVLAFGDLGRQIVVRGEGQEERWRVAGMIDHGGKQAHMASAASEISGNYQVDITRASTLLIDDDGKNISIALTNGVRALYYRPSSPNSVLNDIVKMSFLQN